MKFFYTILISLFAGNVMAQGKFFGGNGDGFATSQTAMILPVDLISFEAALKNNIAQISWSAITQQIASFVLEVSNDGNRFERLTEKTPLENTMAPVQYGYADGPRTGLWYYRLKWQEADGSEAYSKVVAVNFPVSIKTRAIYDAGAGMLTVTKPAGEALIAIYSVEGRLLKEVRNYETVCKVDVKGLAAGLYIVRIVTRQGAKAHSDIARFIAP